MMRLISFLAVPFAALAIVMAAPVEPIIKPIGELPYKDPTNVYFPAGTPIRLIEIAIDAAIRKGGMVYVHPKWNDKGNTIAPTIAAVRTAYCDNPMLTDVSEHDLWFTAILSNDAVNEIISSVGPDVPVGFYSPGSVGGGYCPEFICKRETEDDAGSRAGTGGKQRRR